MILSNSAIKDEFCEYLKQGSYFKNEFTSFEAFDTSLSKEDIASFGDLDPSIFAIFDNYKNGIKAAKQGDFEESFFGLNAALDLLSEKSAWAVSLNCAIGYLHLLSDNSQSAIEYFLESLKSVSSDEDTLLTLLCIGNTFAKIGKPKEALKIYELGHQLVGSEMMSTRTGMIRNAHLLTSIVEIYLKTGASEKAESSIRISNNLFFQNKGLKETAITYILWADVLIQNLNNEEAFIKLNNALEITHNHGYSKLSSEILFKMSRLQSENNNPEKANLFLEEAMYQAEVSKNDQVSSSVLSTRAQKCMEDNNLDQAVGYLTEVIEKFEANGDKDYYESVCEILVNIYESKGQYESALYYSKKSSLANQQIDFQNQQNEKLSKELFENIKHLYNNRSNKFVQEKRALEKTIRKQNYLAEIHLKDFKKMESNVKIISGGLINNLKKCATGVQNKYDEIKTSLNTQSADVSKIKELDHELKYFYKVVNSVDKYVNSDAVLLKKEKVDLNKIVAKVLYDLDTEITEQNCLIAIDRLPNIFGNYDQICSLLKNVLIIVMNDNEHSNPIIKMKVSSDSKSHTFTLYDLNNSTPLQNVQLKSSAKLQDSTEYHLGIGYCEGLVEQNDGKLWIPELSDLGAVVSFSFPIK